MDIADFLRKASLFADLTDRNLKRPARACTVRSFDADDYLVRQDDEGVGLFVITSGRVKVVKRTDCVVLASWDFNSIMRTHPEIALDILPIVVKRFRETNEKLLAGGEASNGIDRT